MACLVSFAFLRPFSTSNAYFKGIHSKNSVLSRMRVLGQSTYKTATKRSDSTSSSIIKGILSMNRSVGHHPLTSFRHQLEIVCCHLNVDSCTQMIIISGYWVGPDFDDGWGYVEAFVNPIT